MPIVLKHKETAQIFTCLLVNHYRLEYYGTKYWNDIEEANAQYVEFLEGMGDTPEEWECVDIEESQMKIYNVRLKNDPTYDLFLDENGRPVIKKNS
jgi:hypothetical protein